MNDMAKNNVAVENKYALTIKEAADYFNIGEHRIRELTDKRDCPFVLWVGSKRLVKRKVFEEYLEKQFSI